MRNDLFWVATGVLICCLCVPGVTADPVAPTAPPSSPIIVNHTSTNLSQVPLIAITNAKSKLHIAYGHTSHGSQIITGMENLTIFPNAPYGGSTYTWNDGGTGGALDIRDKAGDFGEDFLGNYDKLVLGEAADLGNPNFTAWANSTRKYLQAHPDINVIIWSWCEQLHYATESDVTTYLSLMNQLEIDYPNVKFVYMTGTLEGTGEAGNLNQRNEQIRNYVRANNKTLYDFADIESFDPDGIVNYMKLNANYTCDYDGGNWAIAWQNNHTQGVDWYECESAHTQPLNANLKAYAAWHLWARLGGWDGNSGTVAPVTGFTGSPRSGASPLTVAFSDQSTNTPTNWDWYFGNGTKFSDLQDPEITLSAGTFTINLYTSNEAGGDWENKTDYITVSALAAPVAEFAANQTSGSTPLWVTLTDSSTNTPTNWDWYFGNGTKFSDEQNPEIMLSTGTYDINLYASNANGGDWENKTGYIVVGSTVTLTLYPAASEDARIKRVAVNEPWMTIIASPATELNTTQITSYCEEDASATSDQYTQVLGIFYTVNTSALPDDCIITGVKVGWYVWGGGSGVGKPGYAYIGYTPTTNGSFSLEDFQKRSDVPLYTDILSYDSLRTSDKYYTWTGNAAFIANISKTGYTNYALFDTFVLNREAPIWNSEQISFINGYMSDNPENKPYIEITYSKNEAAPVTGFTANQTSGTSPLPVKFTDSSTNTPTNWDWYFGNGTKFSDLQNPEITLSAGIFTINLYTSNANGGDWENKTNYITVTATAPAPTVSGITPATGQNTTTISITHLAGTGFYGTPTVNLTKSGELNITASSVYVVDSTNITCRFDLTGKKVGAWNVTVVNPDGQEDSLVGGFTVTSATIVSAKTGVYRPGAGFYLKMDNGSTWIPSTDVYLAWDNAAGDLPIAGDWNNDGRSETGVYRPGAGFYLKMDNGSTWIPSTDVYLAWDNAAGDLPIAGDWNNDGRSETGVYRPGVGFYLKMDNGSTWTPSTDVYLAWDNAAGDRPIAGDWNNDGRSETGVYRPGVGFYLKMDNGSTWTPSTDVYLAWDNAAGDRPIAGDWNADGRAETGVYRPGVGFYLKMDNGSTWTPSTDQYLAWDNWPTDQPIAGNFV
jgi:PKD repeat protein